MIVRIPGEGQYRLPSAVLDDLNNIDNQVVDAIAEHDASEVKTLVGSMRAMVLKHGVMLGDDELVESDLILPNADLTLDEAEHLFVGEGMMPG